MKISKEKINEPPGISDKTIDVHVGFSQESAHENTFLQNISTSAQQFMKFCFVSLPGMGIAFIILNILMAVWGNFALANGVTFIIVVTWNFLVHRKYTFGCSSTRGICQWFKYFLACLLATVLNWSISMGLYYNTIFFAEHFNCSALVGTGLASVATFIISRKCVFRIVKQPSSTACYKSNRSPSSPLKKSLYGGDEY